MYILSRRKSKIEMAELEGWLSHKTGVASRGGWQPGHSSGRENGNLIRDQGNRSEDSSMIR